MNHKNDGAAIESFKADPVPGIIIKNSIPALIAILLIVLLLYCYCYKKSRHRTAEK